MTVDLRIYINCRFSKPVSRGFPRRLRAYAEVVTLALVAQVGLAAELIGVIALGLYLLIFRRVNSVSVFSTRWVPVAASLICPRSWARR
jgi:hypothetical protein